MSQRFNPATADQPGSQTFWEEAAEALAEQSEHRCFTCWATDKPLSGWGPFCSDVCRDKADLGADQAAEHLYSYEYEVR